MNPKITAKNVLNYIRTTKDRYKFRREDSYCPIACFLKSLGYTDVSVDSARIKYKNTQGGLVEYDFAFSYLPLWVSEFVDTYDWTNNRKNRLATASKVLERVVSKQVNRKMTTKSFAK